MSTSPSTGGASNRLFLRVAFFLFPAVLLAMVAVFGAIAPHSWTAELGPLPWVVSLVLVGLPHGAADLAVSRTAWHGRPLAVVWLAYTGIMILVATAFLLDPRAAIVAFLVVSCWHFGAAAGTSDGETPADLPWAMAVVARGGAVLAAPLACWPAETAQVAADLAALAVGSVAAADLFPTRAVMLTGIMLAILTAIAIAIAGVVAMRTAAGRLAWLQLISELLPIAMLGWAADPLLSVGTFFLLWHAWRQMEHLCVSLRGERPTSWRDLGRSLVGIHVACLPLLLPSWAAVGMIWWNTSTTHAFRNLAIVSIAGYLVVTPAHELLDVLLHIMSGPRTTTRPASIGSGLVHLALGRKRGAGAHR